MNSISEGIAYLYLHYVMQTDNMVVTVLREGEQKSASNGEEVMESAYESSKS